MNAAEREDSFLEGENEQAWAHYRHIENARSQYLGFFFAASLGSAAFAVPILHSSGDKSVLQSLSAAAFLVVFDSFAFFVLTTILRWGAVLANYRDAMTEIRVRRVEILGLPESSASYLSPRKIGAPWHGVRTSGAQKAAIMTLTSFLVGGTLLLLVLAILAESKLPSFVWIIELAAFLASAAASTTAIVIQVTSWKRLRESDKAPSQAN